MARKVRYGLRNTKYALWNEAEKKYGDVKDFPWAVSLSLSREGGDGSDFWADDQVCFSFAGSNGGYSGDLTMSNIPDSVRVDLLGEVLDEGTGVQFEFAGAEPSEFALITEMQTDQGPIAFVFYNCKASRPEIAANTMTDSPSVDTEALNLRISTRDFEHLGVKQAAVQGHIQKSSDNAAKYTEFFTKVVVPTAAAA